MTYYRMEANEATFNASLFIIYGNGKTRTH